MSVYKDLKKAFGATIDMIAEKTSLQAQKSRLLTVMKNEEKTADRAYIALGKYLYTTLRDGMPEDVEQLCRIIDTAKVNMTRAQELYREVIKQDELTTAQNTTEVKENFRKVREPLVAGAASTATKAGAFVKTTAKDTAAKAESLKAAAAERAEDIKQKMQYEKSAAQAEQESAAIDDASDYEEAYIGESEPMPEEIYNISAETPAPIESTVPVEESTAEESAPTDAASEMPTDVEIETADAAAPESSPASEDQFEAKPVQSSTKLLKAQRLHDIISKRNSGSSVEE